jgi:hypothetical protein
MPALRPCGSRGCGHAAVEGRANEGEEADGRSDACGGDDARAGQAGRRQVGGLGCDRLSESALCDDLRGGGSGEVVREAIDELCRDSSIGAVILCWL